MTAVSRPLYFDRTHIDKVVLVVMAVDAFSGRIITRGVRAHIEKQISGGYKRFPVSPVRNVSGKLVFLNRSNQAPLGSPPSLPVPPYRIVVDAQEAGYFNPSPVMVNALPNSRQLLLRLHQRPDAGLDPATTSVSGVVVRGAARVYGAMIKSIFTAGLPPSALPPNQPPVPFETRSDERGAFSLRMRLPDTPVDVKFEISDSGQTRDFVRNVTEGIAYAFEDPINLLGTFQNNDPPTVELAA